MVAPEAKSHGVGLTRMTDHRFKIFQPYIPLLVDEGFLCRTCNQKLPLEEWVKESLGQCQTCWGNDPRVVPCHRDAKVVFAEGDD